MAQYAPAGFVPDGFIPDGFTPDQPSGGGMNFAVVNGQRVPVEDSPLDLVAGAASTLNPVPAIQQMGQALPLPKAIGGGGVVEGPVNAVKGLLKAQGAVGQKMVDSYKQGDYLTAARHAVDWLLPIIGPAIDQAADKAQQGQPWRGAGEAIGLALGLAGPKALEGANLKVPAIGKNPNPVEAAAIEAGQARGIPIDAGTATGNRFVKAVQAGADQTPVGAMVAERARGQQSAALARVGGELADQVHPSPVTPEQAGAALKGSTEDLIRSLDASADQAYGKLRDIEASPEHARTIYTAPEGSRAHQQILNKLSTDAPGGATPTRAELMVMRQIEAELDAQPYTKGKLVDEGNNEFHYTKGGGAGASVYHDIGQKSGVQQTRSETLAGIRKTLNTGEWTSAGRGAYEVAQDRLASGNPGGPNLPNRPPLGAREEIGMAVDLGPAKKALTPMYERLKREAQLVPMMGEKGRGLVALDRLMNGPEFAPVSVVDGALSDLKAMARGASMPELRSQGQGLAAGAVKALEEQVQAAVKRAGPEAVQALEQGRSAVKTKAAVAQVLEDIKSEPVKAYRSAVAPKDTAVAHLRQLQDVAPDVVPQVGRAWLEDALNTATAQGGFEHAAKLDADWRRLGPETKTLIFGGPENVKALDQYFQLAKKLAESPNPSKTTLTATSLASGGLIFTNPAIGIPVTIGAGALSKMLRTPRAIRLLTKGTSMLLGPGRTSQAAQAAGVADVIQAAREAGVMAGTPATAQDQAR